MRPELRGQRRTQNWDQSRGMSDGFPASTPSADPPADLLRKGRYRVRLARGDADVRRAQRLRFRCFRQPEGKTADGLDRDRFDPLCQHFLIEDIASGGLVCCFRLRAFGCGRDIADSYSAQFYGLAGFADYPAPMAEMGRFCIDPTRSDVDIPRIALGALGAYVDQNAIGMLFGCSSFNGTRPEPYCDSFALLARKFAAPRRWRPTERAPHIIRFEPLAKPDLSRAMKGMPPLLRSYLAMGGWVSDHAVIDPDLGTIHVFTGLEVASIPSARARLLRGISA